MKRITQFHIAIYHLPRKVVAEFTRDGANKVVSASTEVRYCAMETYIF